MSTNEPTAWEDKLSATEDPDERRKIAADAVQESLLEAQRRAQKVIEIESARGDDQHPAVTGMATHTSALLDPILGMWKH
jgi:hypothetical protein